MKKALTIAGSDPSGGAGIEADLKTFSAFGVYGMSVITAVTAQNTLGVQSVLDLSPDLIAAQLDSVLGDVRADAVKTGMLSSRSTVEVVGEKLKEYEVEKLVIDPVMAAGSGDVLFGVEERDCLRGLFPLATMVTPNLEEAKFLSGLEVKDLAGMKKAAEAIHKLGCSWVLIKGGHLEDDPVDILYDGKRLTELRGERIPVDAHGTGCAFSAAITAGLARGEDVEGTVRRAKTYITEAIRASLHIGRGRPSVNHLVSST